jgi:phosphoglycolate phosphatase-like HAD superfamily hydrolase
MNQKTQADSARPFVIYVDVDETFVRSVSTKRIPMPSVIRHIRALKEQGAVLYCWSSGGSEYARESAQEFGIADCFVGFLPKPDMILDDQHIRDWRYLKCVHPNECDGKTLDDYRLGK